MNCRSRVLVLAGVIVLAWASPASSQTQSWHVQLDSFQFAEVQTAPQRVLLGGTPTNSVGLAITPTATEEIAFPDENYAVTLLKGVPTLLEGSSGALTWSAFQVLFEMKGLVGAHVIPQSL